MKGSEVPSLTGCDCPQCRLVTDMLALLESSRLDADKAYPEVCALEQRAVDAGLAFGQISEAALAAGELYRERHPGTDDALALFGLDIQAKAAARVRAQIAARAH